MRVYCNDTGDTIDVAARSPEEAAKTAAATTGDGVDGEHGVYTVFDDRDGAWLRFDVWTRVEINHDVTGGNVVDDPTTDDGDAG